MCSRLKNIFGASGRSFAKRCSGCHSHRSPETYTTYLPMTNDTGFIPPHGNYEELLSYQKAEVVYDLTFRFCQRFLTRGDRTIDQMVQAARSGKQNIAEASKASG